VSPDLGSSNQQPLPPEGGKMTKSEVVTEKKRALQTSQAHDSESITNAQTSNPPSLQLV
jgi:hypothetical protein